MIFFRKEQLRNTYIANTTLIHAVHTYADLTDSDLTQAEREGIMCQAKIFCTKELGERSTLITNNYS